MGSLFFAQHNSWEIYQGIYMFWSFLSYWRVSHSIYELWFNHSLLAGHLGSFLFEVKMNKTVINMWVQIFCVKMSSFRWDKLPRSEIAGSYDSCMSSFFKTMTTVYQSGWTILHFHQQRKSHLVPPHPYHHLTLSLSLTHPYGNNSLWFWFAIF